MLAGAAEVFATSPVGAESAAIVVSGLTRLAQAQPAQTPAPPAAPAAAATASDEPIGNVATLTGSATVTRNNTPAPLKLQDDIFENDVLQTSANSTLGVTFNDATTFNLTANAQITVDSFVYEDGGKQNGALFAIAKGTVAFAAAAVAKTGDMRISTPTATLGIRGTTGLVEVPEGAAATAANPNNVAIKLYPDADGSVGRIEVNGRDGLRLGFLTQGASGFTIRAGAGGRFTAAPLFISPQQALRDQGIVRQVHVAQSVGRQIVTQKRIERLQNPGRNNPGARQPGLQRPNGLPQRPGAPQPGQQRPELQRPELQRPGLQRQGAPNAPGLQRPPGQFRPALAPKGKLPPKKKK
ncbi:MAG: iron dicitrate transport regulator FecR [Bradyrhizobium sp.]|nr:MAG: iron dicitrate transport regulator FecR [Bradyrhizobium sp.]